MFLNTHVYISFGIWRLEQDVILEARVARCFFICVVFGLGFFSASVFVFLEINVYIYRPYKLVYGTIAIRQQVKGGNFQPNRFPRETNHSLERSKRRSHVPRGVAIHWVPTSQHGTIRHNILRGQKGNNYQVGALIVLSVFVQFSVFFNV